MLYIKRILKRCGSCSPHICETQANQIVKDWWDFAWILVARYDDGYVNEPGKMAQEVGYPKDWYDKSEWPNGPKNQPIIMGSSLLLTLAMTETS